MSAAEPLVLAGPVPDTLDPLSWIAVDMANLIAVARAVGLTNTETAAAVAAGYPRYLIASYFTQAVRLAGACP